jgi:hypothetical protein
MTTKRAEKQTADAIDNEGKEFLIEGEMKRLFDAAQRSARLLNSFDVVPPRAEGLRVDRHEAQGH